MSHKNKHRKNMKFLMLRSYMSKTLSVLIFLTLFASFALAQSINGIYGDGSVSLPRRS